MIRKLCFYYVPIFVLGVTSFQQLANGARTVFFDINIYPETQSFEVTADILDDGNDGLAGFSIDLVNVGWSTGTAPVLFDENPPNQAAGGFNLQLSAPFGERTNFGGGQVYFNDTFDDWDASKFITGIGLGAGGEVLPGTTGSNVPWSDPVVLIVGGYDSPGAITAFDPSTELPANANLFLRDGDDINILRADGTIQLPPGGAGAASMSDLELLTWFLGDSGGQASGNPPNEDPINFVFSSHVINGMAGPEEGNVEAWLEYRLSTPEPSSIILALCVCSFGAFLVRRKVK